MRKSLIRILYLIGLAAEIIGGILFGVSLAGSTTGANPYGTGTTITSVGNPALLTAAVPLFAIGGILILVALIGALINTARLGRWAWFVCLIIFSGITLLVYVIAGPETPANPVNAAYPVNTYPPNNPYPPNNTYPPNNPYPPS